MDAIAAGSRPGVRTVLRGAGPILVTGMPRSGTTWLARLLATASGAALTGREPMNPHRRQYRLGGTLRTWTELDQVNPYQRLVLRSAFAGLNPLVFGRYGRRQWIAPLPWSRVIIKDPFAMLSVPTLLRETSTTAVILYRHPGAMLVSYRRMGWQPDLEELDPVLAAHRRRTGSDRARRELGDAAAEGEAVAMGRFWSALYGIALDNMDNLAGQEARVRFVAHEELAGGGADAGRALFDVLGLRWSAAAAGEYAATEPSAPRPDAHPVLHEFGRAPTAVAGAWRDRLAPEEVLAVERVTEGVRERLHSRRLALL